MSPSFHARRCTLTSCALLVGVFAVSCANAAENQTELAEEAGTIPSIFWDLRLEPNGVRPGMPPRWPHALVTVSYNVDTITWADDTILVNAPGQPIRPTTKPLEERRSTGQLELRQSLWTPFPWDAQIELEGAEVSRTATYNNSTVADDTMLIASPRAQLMIPVWHERYAGVMVGGGVSLPTNETTDWFTQHDKTGGVVSARWSFMVPYVNFITGSISGEYRFVNGCTQEIYPSDPVQDATTDYRGYSLGGRLGIRLIQEASLGVTWTQDEHRFNDIQIVGLSHPINEKVKEIRAGGYLSIMVDGRFHITGLVRQDNADKGWGLGNLSGGIQLDMVPW